MRSVGRPLRFFRAAEAIASPKVYADGRASFRTSKMTELGLEPSFSGPVK